MAGNCCGSLRVLPRLDPAACNALKQTASGLLVPRTELAGVAPGTAVGTARSVDVDVTAPAAGACPETWTVGARLTPVSGEVFGADANLQAVASGTWVATSAQLVLPEAGTYALSADFFSHINATTPWAVAINARLFNVTAGAPVPGSNRRIQFGNINDPGGGTVMSLQNAGSLSTFLTVTAPTTIRVEGLRQYVGFNDSTQAVLAGPRLGFLKVSD
ncbi:hypothetical protein [Streptomyces sp. Root369]|uniref:hypothetical protein n=1 Tax=Streptomyces sp. Root369 TaxID=1736523 RepID=UPI00070D7626|nr:hypothetical protein [Streptomyces sp. Root369]KQW11423.1 hypothetical protein ASD08_35720 [Streptomyces sp. Root369]